MIITSLGIYPGAIEDGDFFPFSVIEGIGKTASEDKEAFEVPFYTDRREYKGEIEISSLDGKEIFFAVSYLPGEDREVIRYVKNNR